MRQGTRITSLALFGGIVVSLVWSDTGPVRRNYSGAELLSFVLYTRLLEVQSQALEISTLKYRGLSELRANARDPGRADESNSSQGSLKL